MTNQFDFRDSPMPPKPKKKGRDGFTIAALVLGIVGFVFTAPCCCCMYPVAGICAILAIVFSIISLKRNGKNGFAIAGLILGGLALLTLIIFIGISFAVDVPDDPDASSEEQMINQIYAIFEKFFGKEYADMWREEVEKILSEQQQTQPATTTAILA